MERVLPTDAANYEGSAQGVVHGDRVYVQGTFGLEGTPEAVAYDAVREHSPGDVREQTGRAIDDLEAVLGAAGTSLDNVVKPVVYLDHKADFDAMNEVYAERLPEPYPARFAAEVDLPARVQIVASATLDGDAAVIETREAIDYDLPVSQGFTLNDTTYVQGMAGVPVEPLDEGVCPMEEIDDRLVEGAEAQARVAIENGATVLDAVGAGLGDVSKAGIYLDDRADYPAVQRAYEAAFDAPSPVRYCYEAELFSAVEMELIAELQAQS